MNPFALTSWLNPGKWVAVIAAIATVYGLYTWRMYTADAQGYARAKNEYAAAALKASEKARATESALTGAITIIQQKAINDKQAITARLAAANDSLRNRPDRPSADLPSRASSSVGCTGASLFASDARVALWEAARADGIRLQLEACKASYDAAVKLTN